MPVDVRLFGDFDVRGLPVRVSADFGGGATVFEARLGDLTLGDVIAYLVGLAVPELEVRLPPPWSVLETVSLRDLVLRLDVTHGSVGVRYEHVDLDLGFLRLDTLEVAYTRGAEVSANGGGGSVDVKLFGRLLDRSFPAPDHPLTWDLLREPPPAVPAGGSPAFRLDYLGLGQRVTLRDPSKAGNMAAVVDALERAGDASPDSADPLAGLSTLRFDRSAGWLIGAKFAVLDTLTLLAVFNDPVLYGLRVELAGERAGAMAGLDFEILYRKVGPGLGVYHLELQLPEAMRHLDVGAAAVTLPYVVVDVWTNGDFMVDLGFPHDLDFSRSFTLQAFVGPVPVIGAGGFYFGVLRGETTDLAPSIDNGRFAPVIAFGIGLQIGVGRTIEIGLLRAGIVIAIEGALEGVAAFFEPEGRGGDGALWYRVRGTVALVGHIYGEIDFTVVKARVDLMAYASASLTLEACATAQVVLEAGVKADLRVKVTFFHVHLSFHARVRQVITLGRAGQTPWHVAPAGGDGDRLLGAAEGVRFAGAGGHGRPGVWHAGVPGDTLDLLALEAPGAAGGPGLVAGPPVRGRGAAGPGLLAGPGEGVRGGAARWAGERVVPEVRTLDLYFHPMVTVGMDDDRPGAEPTGTPSVQLVALFFVGKGGSAEGGPAGFEELAWAVLGWALAAVGAEADTVVRHDLARAFHDLVASGDPERVEFCDVADFLRENFHLRVRPFPGDAAARSALGDAGLTLFPALPWLTLRAEAADHEADLERYAPCSPAYRAAVDAYFRRLHPEPPPPRPAPRGPELLGGSGSPPPDSLAAFVFADAARLVLRGVLRAGLDAFGAWEAEAEEGDDLAALALRYGAAGDDPVDEIARANRDQAAFWASGATLRLEALRVRVREGESLEGLAERVGAALPAVAEAATDVPGLLRPGAAIAVEGGRVVTQAGETVAALARRLATTVEDLTSANPNLPWPPGPDGTDRLEAGIPVDVPPLRWTVEPGATYRRISSRFGVAATDLATRPDNAGSDALLTPGASLPIPTVERTVEDGDTPGLLAHRYGLTVPELVARTDAAGAAYGRVRIPGCRRLPAGVLRDALRDRGAFDGVAASLARFLLGGLRLPDPATWGRDGADGPDGAGGWGDVRLHPLYVLTGQQWSCAPGDPGAERIRLTRNPLQDGEACQRPLVTFESETPDEGITVPVGAEEAALVEAYRKLAASGTPVAPGLLSAARSAPFVVVPRRFALGRPVAWHAPRVPAWAESAGGGGDPVIFDLPPGLPRLLRLAPDRSHDPRLVVRARGAAGEGGSPPREIGDRAWATRVELEIRRARDPASPGGFLASVFEVYGTDGPGRERLLELVEHLRAHPERTARIELLRPADPTGPDGAGLRSDPLEPADVVLLRTNLSTWTRPPSPRLGAAADGPDAAPPLHATLADPGPFLELLWEASVVATGGFHLVYGRVDGTGPPPDLFGGSESATLTALVVVSPSADAPESVPAEPFHDCVVSAEAPGDGVPFLEPPLFVAGAATSIPDLASSLGIDAGALAAANASVPGLVKPGSTVTLPDVGAYVVQPGDDLLSLAMRLTEPSLDAVAGAVAGAGAVVAAGTRGWTHPAWVAVRPVLRPGTTGLRVLRTDPDPAPPPSGGSGGSQAQDDPAIRLRALYNLLDARVEAGGPFHASPRTLPVAPATPVPGDVLNPPPDAPPAPWRYERFLGLAELVAGDGADDGSYPGLGAEARLTFRLLDLFGNRCLPPEALPEVRAPVRYTDALVPPGHWPGVGLSYRFDRDPDPRMGVRADVDVARVVAAAGAPAAPARERAAADREVFRVAGRQLARPDVEIRVWSTVDSTPQTLERQGLVDFLSRAGRWLDTAAALVGGSHEVAAKDTPGGVASRWRIPLEALAGANLHDPGLLAPGRGTLRVPRLAVVVRGDTLGSVADAAGGGEITPAALAALNRRVPLRVGAELRVGAAARTAVAGETLESVAGGAGIPVEELGGDNADARDLFPPGTRLLVDVVDADVTGGDTLAALAAAHRLAPADLLAANAGNEGLLAAGVLLAIPDHVALGEERSATATVGRGETPGALAGRLGVDVEALVRANLPLDGLLAGGDAGVVVEARARSGAVARVRVADGDTLATLLHRLRDQPGCGEVDASALARGVAGLEGLLAEGAVAMAPPAPLAMAVPVAPDYADFVLPLRVTVEAARAPASVDPALPAGSPVAVVRSDLSPATADAAYDAPDGEPSGLTRFARDFEEAFPELRLATASGAGAPAGGQGADRDSGASGDAERRAAPPGSPRIALFAVQLRNREVSWRIDARPVFYAPRPLLVTPWTTPVEAPAPVRPYADGALGSEARRSYHAVDLDRWGRELLEAVDRFLDADHAVTAHRLCVEAESGAYDAVVGAKATLAGALRDGLAPVLDPSEGDPPGDPEAAKEAFHQRVLARLAQAYRTDAVVQLPATVRSSFPDRAVAPRLSGRVVPTTYAVPEGATLAGVASDFEAPVEILATLVAGSGALLAEGAVVEAGGRRHTVAAGDTLASVAGALGMEPADLAAAVADRPDLLRPGAPVDLNLRTRAVEEDDTPGTLLEALADGTEPAEAASRFAALNADLPGLLRRGVEVTVDTVPVREGDSLVSIARALAVSYSRLGEANADTRNVLLAGAAVEYAGKRWTVREGDSLREVAEGLELDVAHLSKQVQTRSDLLRPAALLRRVRPLTASVGPDGRLGALAAALGLTPEALLRTQLDTADLLREGTVARWLERRPALTLSDVKLPLAEGASLTFLLRTASARRARRVPLSPELRVTEVEYDIRDVSWAGDYQASRWLTLLEPVAVALQPFDVPVALRSHPVPPAVVGQSIRPRIAEEPDLSTVRRYDYLFGYAYERAAQDELFFELETNVPDAPGLAFGADPVETLPYALARYDAAAEPLWADLAGLRNPDALEGDPEARARVTGAVEVFAELVTGIADAWARWDPPSAMLRPGPLGAAGGAEDGEGPRWRVLLSSGPGASPRVRPDGDTNGHVSTAREVRARLQPPGAEQVILQEVPGQDALRTQNLRGTVRVRRNARLLPGRTTNPDFVYRVAPVGPSARAWPLLEHRQPIVLVPAAVDALPARLAELLARFLGVDPAQPGGEAWPVRVSVSWIFPLSDAERLRDDRPPHLAVEVPVTLSPVAPFDPARDLDGEEGLCPRLARRLAAWLEERGGPDPGGAFRFELAAWASLPGGAADGAKPLVQLRDVRLPVTGPRT